MEPAAPFEHPRRAPDLVIAPLPPPPPPASSFPPRQKTFHLLTRDGDVSSASNYRAVVGTLRALGAHVQVYVDEADGQPVDRKVLDDLVATFEEHVLPVAARTIGQARDVDGDGRFTVFLSSCLTRLAGGRHPVDGFVRGADFDLGLAPPFSNHCDMMYVSSALDSGPHLRTILAHEYTHAVTVSAKSFSSPSGRSTGIEEEGWLDEALAHLGEDLHGFSRTNLDYRVSAFLSQPESYRLVVDDYFAADLFRSHGNRGGTYLFLRYCADRFGPRLLPALIRSKRVGVANLEAATGCRFPDLYREWSVALFLSGFDHSREGAHRYHALDLRQPISDWDLAGPRTTRLVPNGSTVAWRSAPTASRFLVVESARAGDVEVEVVSPPDSELQITAVPLPEDLAELRLEVEAITCPDRKTCLQAKVFEESGVPVQLSNLAWEPLVPGPDPHAPSFRRASLGRMGLTEYFGAAELPALGKLSSRPIPFPSSLDGNLPLIFKVVGTDARGRTVAGWAEASTGNENSPANLP